MTEPAAAAVGNDAAVRADDVDRLVVGLLRGAARLLDVVLERPLRRPDVRRRVRHFADHGHFLGELGDDQLIAVLEDDVVAGTVGFELITLFEIDDQPTDGLRLLQFREQVLS